MSDTQRASGGLKILQVRVAAIREEAESIRSYELRPLSPATLPPYTAGSHVDLYLPNGLVRSYSICNEAEDGSHYVVCVNKEAESRGGSAFLHERLTLGDVMDIGTPRNHFPLAEDAHHSILIAGGIGITPLWSMIQRLERLGGSWELHYTARTRQHALFLDRLERLVSKETVASEETVPEATGVLDDAARSPGRQRMHFRSTQAGDRRFDLVDIVRSAPAGAHFYCCGPAALLSDFEAATARIAADQVHVERFAAAAPTSSESIFTVELAHSGCDVVVPPGTSILDALLEAGVQVPYICREGVCGTCETRVLSGVPDHRDQILSQAERDGGHVIMVCCSRSKTPRLRLDC
jgi:ferredoxin-NADP reductase